jgi:hypothetical protein
MGDTRAASFGGLTVSEPNPSTGPYGPSPLRDAYRAFRVAEEMRHLQVEMALRHVPQPIEPFGPVKPTSKQRQVLAADLAGTTVTPAD